MLPYLSRQQVAPPRTLFWRWFGLGPTGPPGSAHTLYAVRSDSLKLVGILPSPRKLFDLVTDISESQNLAQSRPADLASLNQLYAEWNTQMIAALWQDQGRIYTIPKIVLAGDWNGFNKDDPSFPWNLARLENE
jgi:hypothetical protein